MNVFDIIAGACLINISLMTINSTLKEILKELRKRP